MNLHKRIAIGLVAILLSVNAPAANMCSTLFRSEPGANAVAVSSVDANRAVEKFLHINVDAKEATAIKALVAEYGITSVNNITSVAQDLALKILPTETDVVKRSDKYAQVTSKITLVLENRLKDFFTQYDLPQDTVANKIYNLEKPKLEAAVKAKNPSLTEAQVKKLTDKKFTEYHKAKLAVLRSQFVFAGEIAKIEEFKRTEYMNEDSNVLAKPGYVLLVHKEYADYAMALSMKESYPRDFGPGGVLSAKEYRDVVSSNMWLFTAEGHDDKHLHFAHSHPMASMSFFRLARSKNHLRFALIAGMQEGLDNFQYSWEQEIAEYYDSKGYSLERAMLDIATMSQADLEALSERVGQDGSGYTGWRPSYVTNPAKRPVNWTEPENYEQDLINFMYRSLRGLKSDEENVYMRPDVAPDGIQHSPGYYHKPLERLHF